MRAENDDRELSSSAASPYLILNISSSFPLSYRIFQKKVVELINLEDQIPNPVPGDINCAGSSTDRTLLLLAELKKKTSFTSVKRGFWCFIIMSDPASSGDTGAGEIPEPMSNGSMILLAILSIVVYMVLLRPTTARPAARPANENPQNNQTAQTSNTSNTRINQQNSRPQNNAMAAFDEPRRPRVAPALSDAAKEVLKECQTQPSHVSSTSKVGLNGVGVLVDGVVSYSHTQASTAVSTMGAEEKVALRKNTAKILSQLMPKGTNPPVRGSTIFLSIPENDLKPGDDKLSNILNSLASMYTVFVMMAVDVNDDLSSMSAIQTKTDELWKQLFKGNAEQQQPLLPKHRLMICGGVTGRVALVRQLQRVELVVDYEKSVQDQLTRFGYKVVLYNDNKGGDSSSGLSKHIYGTQ